jgi:hypothetical protein
LPADEGWSAKREAPQFAMPGESDRGWGWDHAATPIGVRVSRARL